MRLNYSTLSKENCKKELQCSHQILRVSAYVCHNNITIRCDMAGCRERAGAGDPVHLQRVARVSHLLAHLRYHGSPAIRRKVLQGNISDKLDLAPLFFYNFNIYNIIFSVLT